MKRLFGLLLVLLLVLCACHRPDGDPTQTTTTQTVQLVTAYYNDNTSSMGAVDMAFTYGETYRDGAVTLKAEEATYTGTFTCDENYNINSIRVPVDETNTLYITCSFDDQHRLLAAEVWLEENQGREWSYCAKYAYDSAGRMIYRMEGNGETKITQQTVYREDGRLLRTIQSMDSALSGIGKLTNIMGYQYDGEGRIQAMVTYSEAGKLTENLKFSYEAVENRIRYVAMQDYTTRRVIETDLQGRILLQETYSGADLLSRVETEYDLAGRTIRQTTKTGAISIEITYAYTADGRLAQQKTVINDQESVIRTTFQTVQITK